MINMLFVVLKYIIWFFVILISFIASATVALKLFLEPRAGVCRCKTKLHGKTVLVTGGNSGIGFETAKDLAKRGARVIIACRNVEKSQKAVRDIVNTTGNDKVEFKQLDLSRFSSVRAFADDFNKNFDRLDILVNNSGQGGTGPFVVTDDGIDQVMQTNHLGPFLLTNLLIDKLIASTPSRIVIVSSYMHNFARLNLEDLIGLETKQLLKYSNSKLCNVLWTKGLAKRLPEGVTANALHPGLVKTDIFNTLPFYVMKFIHLLTDFMFKDAILGAQTTIHLCVCPDLDSMTGNYYKDCKPYGYHKLCNDEKFVDKFWEKCLQITKDHGQTVD